MDRMVPLVNFQIVRSRTPTKPLSIFFFHYLFSQRKNTPCFFGLCLDFLKFYCVCGTFFYYNILFSVLCFVFLAGALWRHLQQFKEHQRLLPIHRVYFSFRKGSFGLKVKSMAQTESLSIVSLGQSTITI